MAARPANAEFVRDNLEELLRRRFFLSRAFDIYGGVAGLYDLGVHLSFSVLIRSLLAAHCKQIL
jgi:glycyl-tRNA synthetase (class II)